MKRLERPKWQKDQGRRKKFWLILLCVFLLVPLSVGVYFIAGNLFSGDRITVSGSTIYVKAGGNLQAAIDRAKAGDTIVLPAGATFVGSFMLPNKVGSGFMTIQSAEVTKLRRDGVRCRR